MRALKLTATAVALAALAAVASCTATGPAVAFQIKCSGCEALTAAGVSPDRRSIVFGGEAGFGLFDRTIVNFTWAQQFDNFNSEQEGPFAFPLNDLFGGLAPDEGTEQTLWGINATNGNLTWTASGDGSLDEIALTAVPGAFVTGAVYNQFIDKYDARTGKKVWKVNLNDFIFAAAAGSMSANSTIDGESFLVGDDRDFGVAVAYGSTASVYNVTTGALIWNVTLSTQAAMVTLAEERDAVYFSGGTDMDGNPLPYSIVYKFDWRTGAPRWTANVSQTLTGAAPLISWLNVRGKTVLAASTTTVTAIDVATGAVRWTAPFYVPSETTQVPSAVLGIWNKTEVVYGSLKGTDLTAIDTVSGKVSWSQSLPNDLVASMSPIFLFDQLIAPAASSDGNHGFVVGYDLEKPSQWW